MRQLSTLPLILIAVLSAGFALAGNDSQETTTLSGPDNESIGEAEKPPPQELPAELSIPLESIPPPVQRTILQRIDDHERMERMLTDQPRELPYEIQVIERDGHIIIRLR